MKRKLFFCCCLIFTLLLVIFSADASNAAQRAFQLWRDALLPALLPLFICSSLLQSQQVLPNSRILLFLLAFLSGAPGGARLAATLEEPEKHSLLAAPLNVLSPAYTVSVFCSGMLHCIKLAAPVMIALFLPSALLYFLLARKAPPQMRPQPPLSCAAVLQRALQEGLRSVLMILATLVFFMTGLQLLSTLGVLSLIARPLQHLLLLLGVEPPQISSVLLIGALEVTNGCAALSSLHLPLRLSASLGASLLSFGGMCILLQSLAFVRIPAGKYLLLKLIQAVLSGLTCYLLVPLFLPEAAAVFAVTARERLYENALGLSAVLASSLLSCAVLLLFSALLKRRKRLAAHRESA